MKKNTSTIKKSTPSSVLGTISANKCSVFILLIFFSIVSIMYFLGSKANESVVHKGTIFSTLITVNNKEVKLTPREIKLAASGEVKLNSTDGLNIFDGNANEFEHTINDGHDHQIENYNKKPKTLPNLNEKKATDFTNNNFLKDDKDENFFSIDDNETNNKEKNGFTNLNKISEKNKFNNKTLDDLSKDVLNENLPEKLSSYSLEEKSVQNMNFSDESEDYTTKSIEFAKNKIDNLQKNKKNKKVIHQKELIYQMYNGMYLSEIMDQWAMLAKWRLVWNTNIDMVVDRNSQIPGDFITAMKKLAEGTFPKNLKLTFYKGNKTVVVENKGYKK